MVATQPTQHQSCWQLPDRKPTITRAMRLLELTTKPRNQQQLRDRMAGWRRTSDGAWGAACGTVDEWVAVQRCRAAYVWLRAQLPAA
jgi:hypothetical protein